MFRFVSFHLVILLLLSVLNLLLSNNQRKATLKKFVLFY
jgi:hypothetical protein